MTPREQLRAVLDRTLCAWCVAPPASEEDHAREHDDDAHDARPERCWCVRPPRCWCGPREMVLIEESGLSDALLDLLRAVAEEDA